jgi:histidinol-phosphate aminotransferase/imidazoleglycerol-phosphate dehydratase/histidinol-phosphatase
MRTAPFPPLIAGGDGLERPPGPPFVLRTRMAEIYDVPPECLLPVRGMLHGAALVMRLAARRGAASIVSPATAEFRQLAKIAGLTLAAAGGARTGAMFVASPDPDNGRALSASGAAALADECELLVVDESLIEFSDAESLAPLAAASDSIIVIRSLAQAYGLAGDPCAALIAGAGVVAALEDLLEPEALSASTLRFALAALGSVCANGYARRFAQVKSERERVRAALLRANAVAEATAADGPFVFVLPHDAASARRDLALHQVAGEWRTPEWFRIDVGAPDANNRALAAFGGDAALRAHRSAEVVRETLETRIVANVDLDAEERGAIDTGVGFLDHMLSQVAAHGGFRIDVKCDGDLRVDAHHTIEDCALALGQALRQALGARRGIARYGFVLPMDEAEARLSIDLGGRPYLVFEAAFRAPSIGAYPTEMTEHVFRSLAQSMGASIHLAVSGENDHHKTEACFKALGRALRQAIRVDGEALPSTKGVIA